MTEAAVREAALVEADCLDAGDRVNLGDVLVAGVCRHRDTSIVTRGDHLDRVDGLDVITYRREPPGQPH